MNLNRQIEEWLRSRIATFQSDIRPFITLAYAQSWDGSITTRSGETLNFSCKESTQLTHQLRSLNDGILVGIGTVLCDDPQLTVREWAGPPPQPIVLDSQLRTPPNAKICNHPDKQCWILTVNSDSNPTVKNSEILTVRGNDKNHKDVPLEIAMKLLRGKGIKSLMVEGGATVITAFIQARMVDAIILTVAPRLVGGYKAINNLQGADSKEQFNIEPINFAQAGEDLVVWGELQYGG